MKIKYLYAVLSGSLFAFGFAPFSLWPLSIASICFFMYLLEDLSIKQSFIVSFFYGLGYWLCGISWVYVSIHYYGNIGIIGSSLITLLFVSCLSIYMGLFGSLYQYLSSSSNKDKILLFPACWVLVEIIRSFLFTGFPWLLAGTTISDTFLGGWISVIGAQGNSLILMILCGSLYILIRYFKSPKPLLYSSVIIGIILFSSLVFRSINWTTPSYEIPVAVYQPNLTLNQKWSNEGVYITKKIIEDSIKEALESELIVFPETALIQNRSEIQDWVDYIDKEGKKKNVSILTGIIASNEDERTKNLIRNRIVGLGAANGSYDKKLLVPFGEFIPLERYTGKLLDIIGINLSNTIPGEHLNLIESTKLRISPSICYEIAFSSLINKTAANSNILVTISNDTWFGASIGPEQHLQIAKDRVLEHQKPLLRSTNSGISAIIDHKGNVLNRQGYFEEKTLKGKVVLQEGYTPYNHLGNLIIYLYIGIIIFLNILMNRTKVVLFK